VQEVENKREREKCERELSCAKRMNE
jgi:hypothetical protein